MAKKAKLDPTFKGLGVVVEGESGAVLLVTPETIARLDLLLTQRGETPSADVRQASVQRLDELGHVIAHGFAALERLALKD